MQLPPIVTNAAVIIAALSLLGLLIRQIGPWKQQADRVAAELRNDLLRRVEKLERTLDRERVRHNAERALDRHRLNNVTACFDAMLLLLELNPDRAPEIVGKIKDMRARQMMSEAEEKAIISAAAIAADQDDEPEDPE